MDSLLRWALLSVLAWGVLAMHHVKSAEPDHQAAMHAAVAMTTPAATIESSTASPAEQNGHQPLGAHELMHLCLAVICVTVGVVLASRLLRAWREWAPRLSIMSSTRLTAARPPPSRRGRDILHTVCVLRV